MGVQVLELLVPHRHKLLEVTPIGPLCQPGRPNTRRLEALQPWLGDAVLDDQLDAVVEFGDDDIDEFLGRELITAHDVLQALVNLVEFSQHLFSTSVPGLQVGKCPQRSAPRDLQPPQSMINRHDNSPCCRWTLQAKFDF